MVDEYQRRICDGVTGAAVAAAIAGVAAGSWYVAVLSASAGVIAQLLRLGVGS
jgi:hypothetical protein